MSRGKRIVDHFREALSEEEGPVTDVFQPNFSVGFHVEFSLTSPLDPHLGSSTETSVQ